MVLKVMITNRGDLQHTVASEPRHGLIIHHRTERKGRYREKSGMDTSGLEPRTFTRKTSHALDFVVREFTVNGLSYISFVLYLIVRGVLLQIANCDPLWGQEGLFR
jgi:hypothetical protein